MPIKILFISYCMLPISSLPYSFFAFIDITVDNILTFKTLSTTCITIIVFVILAILTQIADQYPAIYYKEFGFSLSEHLLFILKIFEEGGESLLPLLFGIGIYQFCNK